jgi:hypothetical protein
MEEKENIQEKVIESNCSFWDPRFSNTSLYQCYIQVAA